MSITKLDNSSFEEIGKLYFEPYPIQSKSKFDQIEKFNERERKLENLHKNDPATEKFLQVSVAVFIVVLAFLIFFKLCWDREKYLRQNPTQDIQSVRRMEGPTKTYLGRKMMTRYQNRGKHPSNEKSIFFPDANIVSGGLSKGKCQGPVCGSSNCAPPTGSSQKGWNRNLDYDPYSPSNV